MSVASISNLSTTNYNAQSVHNNVYQFRQEFKQLGQDLQTGNLSAAQSDLSTLQQLRPASPATPSSTGKHPIADGYNQLAQDLQSGNISAAQQDYTNIQQAYQNLAAHHPHHHGGGEGGGGGISQLLNQLGQALQSGDVSTAKQAYSSLLQDFQQFAQSNGLPTQDSSQASPSSISVNV